MERYEIMGRAIGRITPEESNPLWEEFEKRCRVYSADLYARLFELYGQEEGFLYLLEDLLSDAWESFRERSSSLHAYDRAHAADDMWYASHETVGGVLYVGLFAGDLIGLLERIDYIEGLGINVIHLMPLFRTAEGESDGGYAVSSYRETDPALGSMEDLRQVISAFHGRGISVMIDFILNHTSEEHTWARKAIAGEQQYRDYYFLFPDRYEPDQYQWSLRDIFPEVRQGSFTWHEECRSWVWTTFNSYQWDLNYQNPDVFRAMAGEMMFLANVGVDVLRFDAIAFTWKEKGTSCEGLPKAHTLVRAFRALARICAPSMAFLSEAIVAPTEVLSYISQDECELSYNPLTMATGWEALATRDVRLLRRSLQDRYRLPSGCSWINYIRCHDDIGWTFDDGDAWSLGIDPKGHRGFLNDFYTGRFPGSFACGLPFQENLITGDCRISGTAASLAGLEKGLLYHDEEEITFAIRKLLLLHGIASTLGGIPLLYLGDEKGQINDYSYRDDPDKADDSRWVHRIAACWDEECEDVLQRESAQEIYALIRGLYSLRKRLPVLSSGDLKVLSNPSRHILSFTRREGSTQVTVIAHFSDHENSLETEGILDQRKLYRDLLTGEVITAYSLVGPWQFLIVEEHDNEE